LDGEYQLYMDGFGNGHKLALKGGLHQNKARDHLVKASLGQESWYGPTF
jgi:hypothetical protein